MEELQEFLTKKRKEIDRHLLLSLNEINVPNPLIDAMLYSVKAGGKRIRPILTLATIEAFEKESSIGMKIACAIEMIHTYSLIHDDLPSMDDDDYRRGKLTNHKVFGEANAILAGDGLLTYSFQLIASAPNISPEKKLEIIELISEAAGPEGMVGGQAVDIDSENEELTLEELQSIHERKTGKLLMASILAGAMLANATLSQLEHLRKFAFHLGIAFQIQDDILDCIGDATVMGKPVGSDEHNHKNTYPKLLTLEGASRELNRHLLEAKKQLIKTGINTVILEAITDYIVNRNQ
ncbi:polyprenyl synthetase family protein [Fictibacillus sp. Mic-4]|uniref:polyprenyl synthetase family protein n=1 Tax=Fictibacillus TaxID=1329200 RepID=UPI0004176F05|nr:farnesyl diphosphate synthase [Fictibacillus gelatini]